MQPSLQVSQTSSQSYKADDRNESVLVYLNGEFVPRAEARISIFDAGYVAGDGVWEGVRLVKGRVISFDAHVNRLFEGASTIAMDIGLDREQVKDVVRKTFAVNHMSDGAHGRLMVTRGVKKTPNQDPRFIIGKATIVCVAEHKVVTPESKQRGLKLFTSTIRCSTPDVFDLRLNSHSRLNFIQALIQAINAGADEALMLDPHGFVSSCNSTNFFIVRDGALWTSSGRYCFNGITRATILRLAREAGLGVHEGDYTLAEVYSAEEAFVTGTLGGVTPVSVIDGRSLPTQGMGPMTQRLAGLYQQYINSPLPEHG
jgi:branched-chain amino acid aminotransferase